MWVSSPITTSHFTCKFMERSPQGCADASRSSAVAMRDVQDLCLAEGIALDLQADRQPLAIESAGNGNGGRAGKVAGDREDVVQVHFHGVIDLVADTERRRRRCGSHDHVAALIRALEVVGDQPPQPAAPSGSTRRIAGDSTSVPTSMRRFTAAPEAFGARLLYMSSGSSYFAADGRIHARRNARGWTTLRRARLRSNTAANSRHWGGLTRRSSRRGS